jgi:hypothetical protein
VLLLSSASISDIIGLSGLNISGFGTSRIFPGRFIYGFIVVCGRVVLEANDLRRFGLDSPVGYNGPKED